MKKQGHASAGWLLALMVIVLAAFVAPGTARAEVVIGTGQLYTVTDNVTLKGTFAGIIVAADGVHVNMRNATVDCALPANPPLHKIGVHVPMRSRVHITGGTVQQCSIGVLLGLLTTGGGGSHNNVNGTTVKDSITCACNQFDGDGIVENSGIDNLLINNKVINVGGELFSAGIRIYFANDNRSISNTIQNVKPDGIGAAGILLQQPTGTDLHGNSVSGVTGGFLGGGIVAQLGANLNLISGNTSLGNVGFDKVTTTRIAEPIPGRGTSS